MAEVKDREMVPQEMESAPAAEEQAPKKGMSRKKRKKLIRRGVALVVVLAIIGAGFKFFGGKRVRISDGGNRRDGCLHHCRNLSRGKMWCGSAMGRYGS